MLKNKKNDGPKAMEVLKNKEFLFFLVYRFTLTMAIQMQSVIVGWHVYSITGDVLHLGLIGLTEAIPFIAISFFSGHVADIFKRKTILLIFTTLFIFVSLGLYYLSLDTVNLLQLYGASPIYFMVAVIGVIRGFISAAMMPFLSQIVPRNLYGSAATWNSTVWQIASVIGPSIAGFVVAHSYSTAYSTNISLILLSLLAMALIKSKPVPEREKKESLSESLSVGIWFVFQNKLILGALTLDLFAVLFGGAVALLPDFAKMILHAGPVELGYMRAAPAFGAAVMAMIIAYYPPVQHAGRNLLLAVAGFGLSIILFGFSTNFYFAAFFLFLSGAFDNVSVVIRQTILQLSTPDNMRGRVSAVNGIFIGSSNEIGEFESGVTASAFGTKRAIVFGGIMTLLVVGTMAKFNSKLRNLDIRELE